MRLTRGEIEERHGVAETVALEPLRALWLFESDAIARRQAVAAPERSFDPLAGLHATAQRVGDYVVKRRVDRPIENELRAGQIVTTGSRSDA